MRQNFFQEIGIGGKNKRKFTHVHCWMPNHRFSRSGQLVNDGQSMHSNIQVASTTSGRRPWTSWSLKLKVPNVPSVRRLSKAMSVLITVGIHLVGAIIHNGQAQNGKEIYGSFDYYQFPHDSNLKMTVLLDKNIEGP